jgi:hypothetical protein
MTDAEIELQGVTFTKGRLGLVISLPDESRVLFGQSVTALIAWLQAHEWPEMD